MSTRRRVKVVAASTLALLAVSVAAWAFLTALGIGFGSASAASLAAPTNVTVPSTVSGSTVHVSWTAPTPPGSGTVSYYVQRYAGATPSAACGTSPSSLITATSCDDTGVLTGTYTYKVTALWRTWTKQSAESGSVAVQSDGTPPVTTIAISPSSPNGSNGWYKGTAPTFTLSATDSGSGVANTFYKIDSGSEQTYASAVTIPEGQHTISYWSTDNAGNTESTHTTATIKVDTVAPTFNLWTIAPAASARTFGAGVSGTTVYFQNCPNVNFGARFASSVSDSTSGPASAAYPLLSATKWTTHNAETITTLTSGLYVSSDFLWNPTNCGSGAAAAPGAYTVTVSDTAGNTASTTLSWTADTTAPTVTNVTLNNGGGPPQQGQISANDFVEVTYSEELDPVSFCSAWTNGTTPTLTSGVTATITTGDVLTLSASACTFHFGSVNLVGNYNTSTTQAMTFTTSTSVTWDPATRKLRIVLGSRSGGTVGTGVAAAVPTYQNITAARESDFAQVAIPTTSVSGTSSSF